MPYNALQGLGKPHSTSLQGFPRPHHYGHFWFLPKTGRSFFFAYSEVRQCHEWMQATQVGLRTPPEPTRVQLQSGSEGEGKAQSKDLELVVKPWMPNWLVIGLSSNSAQLFLTDPAQVAVSQDCSEGARGRRKWGRGGQRSWEGSKVVICLFGSWHKNV